ncbi:MAG: hypothetical protein GWM90_14660, partial [Gemmatimonadetes bacterium]|nr:hypothetical protein [Gemmatimonadota bacterium]NIU75622.1 hypothetical protein [Gammaproteobacteria bacterium]NIQ55413.1 hypothetical protein [Gemmatimonadota bacterium]NIW35355.1 hypothetical protein [Gemmatimonadota bacterium]NIX45304.1 hypothetical protein [Gemmatimonadota bacterium]
RPLPLVPGAAALIVLVLGAATTDAQTTTEQETLEAAQRLVRAQESLGHRLNTLEKQIDDALWFDRV